MDPEDLNEFGTIFNLEILDVLFFIRRAKNLKVYTGIDINKIMDKI